MHPNIATAAVGQSSGCEVFQHLAKSQHKDKTKPTSSYTLRENINRQHWPKSQNTLGDLQNDTPPPFWKQSIGTLLTSICEWRSSPLWPPPLLLTKLKHFLGYVSAATVLFHIPSKYAGPPITVTIHACMKPLRILLQTVCFDHLFYSWKESQIEIGKQSKSHN